MAEITWANHSGYVLRTSSGTAMLIDPWFDGTAFNDGWALLSPSVVTAADLADVRHLWISHEHPDHFSPPALRMLPEDQRRQTTVWFRATRDGRVRRYCESLGYRVVELPPDQPVQVADDLRITCGTVGDDSWLLTEVDGQRILNLNDCEFVGGEDLDHVVGVTGTVDVLLTQFSYANGISGPEGRERRASSARNKLRQVARQIQALKPKVVVPFASFVWFCHEENDHLNDEVVGIDRAVAAIEELGCSACVLYPGDRWEVGQAHDDRASVERYRADYASIPTRPRRTSPSVPEAELLAIGEAHQRRIEAKNWLWLLRPLRRHRLLQPLHVEVTDLEPGRLVLDLFDGLAVDRSGAAPTLAISSQSLAFCLQHEFGMDTLLVNGRFRELAPGALLHLRVLLAPAELNNHGHTIPGIVLEPAQLRHGLRRLRARSRAPRNAA